MQDRNLVSAPMDVAIILATFNCSPDVNVTLYRYSVRSLLLLTTSRPDITYSTILFSTFMSEPKETQWGEHKRIPRYLK